MFTKLFLVCAVVAIAMGIEYPPGIDPVLCPNYPYCDMEVLTRDTPLSMPIPAWDLPYPVAAPVPVPAAEAGVDEAPRYPADFDPALCPNYPYCV